MIFSGCRNSDEIGEEAVNRRVNREVDKNLRWKIINGNHYPMSRGEVQSTLLPPLGMTSICHGWETVSAVKCWKCTTTSAYWLVCREECPPDLLAARTYRSTSSPKVLAHKSVMS